jgi:hypothetical protein
MQHRLLRNIFKVDPTMLIRRRLITVKTSAVSLQVLGMFGLPPYPRTFSSNGNSSGNGESGSNDGSNSSGGNAAAMATVAGATVAAAAGGLEPLAVSFFSLFL